jgi:hypothetical protein
VDRLPNRQILLKVRSSALLGRQLGQSVNAEKGRPSAHRVETPGSIACVTKCGSSVSRKANESPCFLFRSTKTKVLDEASWLMYKHGKHSLKTLSRLAKPGTASCKGIAGCLAPCGVVSGDAWSS